MALVAEDEDIFRGQRFVQQPDHRLHVGLVSTGRRAVFNPLCLTNGNDCMMFTHGSVCFCVSAHPVYPYRIETRPLVCDSRIHILSVAAKHNEVADCSLFTIAQ
jgi:hypothetical protein